MPALNKGVRKNEVGRIYCVCVCVCVCVFKLLQCFSICLGS